MMLFFVMTVSPTQRVMQAQIRTVPHGHVILNDRQDLSVEEFLRICCYTQQISFSLHDRAIEVNSEDYLSRNNSVQRTLLTVYH